MDKKIIRYLVEREDTFKRWIGKEKLGMKIHASLLILASLYFYITGKIPVIRCRYLYYSLIATTSRSAVEGTLCYYIYDNIYLLIHYYIPVILLLLAFLAIILAKWGKMLLVCNLFFSMLNLFFISVVVSEASELGEHHGLLGCLRYILRRYCW